MTKNHFAENIRASRLKKKLSLEEVAERAEVITA